MDRLTAMRHFVSVVEAGSFSNAAKRLSVANATVTQSIKNLESHLGVRLLNRTTRGMNLTWEGREYADRCRALLDEIEEAEREIVRSAHSPCGELRVEMPSAVGHAYIVPKMLQFAKLYPEVQTTVFLNPGASSLIEKGIDVAIQLGDLESSSLVARKIHNSRQIACASPAYLKSHGMPRHPDDLRTRECLSFFSPHTTKPLKWEFTKDEERVVISPFGQLRFNSSEALIGVAKTGAGIIYMLDLLVQDYIRSGELVDVLPQWSTLQRGVYIVCPDRQNVPEKVRAFTAFIEGVFSELAPSSQVAA